LLDNNYIFNYLLTQLKLQVLIIGSNYLSLNWW